MKSNMTKTHKLNEYLPLVIAGYGLFSLLIIATLLSTTIPWGMMLFNPRVLHYNVAVFALALTIGSFLPVLVGYMIGDHSVKSNNKLRHHFNGILFGLFAYWMMTLLAVLVIIPPEGFTADARIRIVLANLLPSIGVAVVTTIFAIAHVRSRQARHDLLLYKPFVVVLIAAIAILPLWSLINNIVTSSVSIYSFVSLIIVAVIGLISYVTLHKTKLNTFDKVAWSAVSVSVLFVAVYVSSLLASVILNYMLTPTMEAQTIMHIGGCVLALAGWSIYWIKQVKSLKKK